MEWDLEYAGRTPVALTSHPQVLQHESTRTTTYTFSYIFRISHLNSSEGKFCPKGFVLILVQNVLSLRFMTHLTWRLRTFFSDQFHSYVFLFLDLGRFFHVKSRLQPCRYWLFDQAWESAQSWKDKLVQAADQLLQTNHIIISAWLYQCPALHNRVVKVYEEAKIMVLLSINTETLCFGMFPVSLHKAQLDLMYLQMV